jgi:hypothetical protein
MYVHIIRRHDQLRLSCSTTRKHTVGSRYIALLLRFIIGYKDLPSHYLSLLLRLVETLLSR